MHEQPQGILGSKGAHAKKMQSNHTVPDSTYSSTFSTTRQESGHQAPAEGFSKKKPKMAIITEASGHQTSSTAGFQDRSQEVPQSDHICLQTHMFTAEHTGCYNECGGWIQDCRKHSIQFQRRPYHA
jgi:hypothetical protein